MTLWELEKKLTELDDLRAELNALIAELKGQNEEKPTPPHPRWKPKDDEVYYILCSDGTPYSWSWLNSSDYGSDIHRYSIGNIFRTPAEAEFAAERLKVLAEMREWAGNWNDDWVLQYDSEADTILPVSYFENTKRYGEMTFLTDDDADNCIKAVGEERLKKYYFMIPEGADENT